MGSTVPSWVQIAVSFVQMFFFVVTGSAAVASFRLARKTLLQPARTEIFKAQMEQLRRVLQLLAGKDELALRRDCGMDLLEEANYAKLYDDYARISFGVDIEPEGRPYHHSVCLTTRIDFEALSSFPVSLDPKARDETIHIVRAENWKDYRFSEVSIPTVQSKYLERLETLLIEPLLPAECAVLIQKYLDTIENNINIVQEVLQEAVAQMPVHYPDLEAMDGSPWAWLHNRANKVFWQLEPVAEEVAVFVRGYFGVDYIYSADHPRKRRWRKARSGTGKN